MKLKVNLVIQRPIDRVALRNVCTVLQVLLVSWLIITLGYMIIISQRRQKVIKLLATTSVEVAIPLSAAEQQALQAESAKADNILKRRAFRWSKILNHLEQTGIDGIQVRSIAPDFDKQSLAIQVLARDEAVFREYLGSLLQYQPFSQVLLLRQENATINDALGQTFTAVRCDISIRGGF